MSNHGPIAWIMKHLDVQPTTYGAFFYGQIEQWSPRRIPGVNCDFDPMNKAHFATRATELDFALVVGNGRILDFGPGDGWPALRIAQMVESVVGIEASQQRVATCRRNASRSGIENAEFVLVEPGQSLPFDDDAFDGVVASWSLEETPDLEATVRELFRVLRPGAKMRFERIPMSFFTSLNGIGMYVGDALAGRTIVLTGHPDTRQQEVVFYSLLVNLPRSEFAAIFKRHGLEPVFDALTDEVLSELHPHIISAGTWTTRNPDCGTWFSWLLELGFQHAETTYNAGWMAERYFDSLPKSKRPTSEDEVDAMLCPLVEAVITLEAPHHLNAPITVTK